VTALIVGAPERLRAFMPDLITALQCVQPFRRECSWQHRRESHIVDKTELYVRATIMTPVKGLTFGASWDSINNAGLGHWGRFPRWVGVPASSRCRGLCRAMAGYVSYKITDKLTIQWPW